MHANTTSNTTNAHIKTGSIPKVVKQMRAHCPSCGQVTTFSAGGVQHVPPAIAAAAGLPQAIHLYHCGSCNSTISDQDLMS